MIEKITCEQLKFINSYYSEYTIVVWSSSIIGRDSKYGDIDMYIIGEIEPDIKHIESEVTWDIEFIPEKVLYNMLNALKDETSFLELSELKVLFKLTTGEVIRKVRRHKDIFNMNTDNTIIQNSLIFYWNTIFISLLEDIVKFNYSNLYEETVFQVFNLMECAEAIYLCNKGVPCIKKKWIHSDFLRSIGHENSYTEEFNNLIHDLNNYKYECFTSKAIDYSNRLRFQS